MPSVREARRFMSASSSPPSLPTDLADLYLLRIPRIVGIRDSIPYWVARPDFP